MFFHNLVIISPWERAETFIWTNLNRLYTRMLCGKFGGSGNEDENGRRTTGGQKSSLEILAQVSWKHENKLHNVIKILTKETHILKKLQYIYLSFLRFDGIHWPTIIPWWQKGVNDPRIFFWRSYRCKVPTIIFTNSLKEK